MSFAVNAQTQLSYIVEATPGVTPATPAFNMFRVKGETLKVVRSRVATSELNGRRGQQNSIIASGGGNGGVQWDWTYQTLQDHLQSALRSAWVADVMVDANTPLGLTVEAKAESGATDIYKRLIGAEVDTMQFEVSPGAIISGSCGYMARNSTFANAAIAGATYVAGNAEVPLIGSDLASIAMAAGLTLDNPTKISINISNKLREQRTLNGSIFPANLGAGVLEVTGVISTFMDSTEFDLVSAFVAGTETGLDFKIGNTAAKRTRFELPRIVFEDAEANSSSTDGDLMINIPFRALQSTTLSGGVIRVTRNYT